MKKLILTIIILLFAWPCWGAIRLVSKTGTDAGDCTSAACLTINYAQGQADAGDTISIGDGTYVESSGSGYLNITKYGQYQAVNSGQVIIQSTASPVVRITAAADGTFVFDGIKIDAQDTYNTAFQVVDTIYNSCSLSFINEVTLQNWIATGLLITEPSLSITTADLVLSASNTYTSSKKGIKAEAIMTAGVISLVDTVFAINNTSAGNGSAYGISIFGSAGTSATVSIVGSSGTIAINGTAGNNVIGQRIRDIPDVIIDGQQQTITVHSEDAASTAIGVQIYTSGEDASGGTIKDTDLVYEADIGFGIVIGATTSGATDDLTNNSKIYGNTITRTNAGTATTPHGIAMLFNQGGEVYGNTAQGFSPNYIISKTDATTVVHSNIAIKPYMVGSEGTFYSKGATSSKICNNTVITETGYTGYVFAITDSSDSAVHSTGVEWRNNIVYSTATSGQYWVYAADDNTFTASNNDYYSSGSLAAAPFSYQSTTYATLTLWQTAGHDSDSIETDPLFISATDGNFNLQADSPCINTGTPNGSTPYTSAITDLNGNTITDDSGDCLPAFGNCLDMGAYESLARPFFYPPGFWGF